MTHEMYEIRIDIRGREIRDFCYWLIENINEWDISIWCSHLYGKAPSFTAPNRRAPHRISSVDWERSQYKILGLSDDLYEVNAMMYNDVDAMAVKLTWQ